MTACVERSGVQQRSMHAYMHVCAEKGVRGARLDDVPRGMHDSLHLFLQPPAEPP